MNNILFLKTSLNGAHANSNKIAYELITKLKAKTGDNVIVQDVASYPLPHLSQLELDAWMTPELERTDEQKSIARVSDSLIEELKISDTIVLAIPMYNFGTPSSFKAWADRVARAGITFQYSENGPVGLLKNKKVIVVATRGGIYKNTPKDSQTQFLKNFFSFIGIDDIQFIYAEGLNMPDGDKKLLEAQAEIENFSI